jgi:hypothetical protein
MSSFEVRFCMILVIALLLMIVMARAWGESVDPYTAELTWSNGTIEWIPTTNLHSCIDGITAIQEGRWKPIDHPRDTLIYSGCVHRNTFPTGWDTIQKHR